MPTGSTRVQHRFSCFAPSFLTMIRFTHIVVKRRPGVTGDGWYPGPTPQGGAGPLFGSPRVRQRGINRSTGLRVSHKPSPPFRPSVLGVPYSDRPPEERQRVAAPRPIGRPCPRLGREPAPQSYSSGQTVEGYRPIITECGDRLAEGTKEALVAFVRALVV